MKRSILIVLLGLGCQLIFARSKDTTRVANKPSYFFHVQTGPLVRLGSNQQISPMTFATAMVHGIRIHDRYNIGLGIGLDYYETRRVVPLFTSFSADLIGHKNKLFLEVNYGGAHSRPLTEVYGLSDSKPGYFLNPNLGYSIKIEKLSVSFIAGVKFQRMTDYYAYPYTIYNNDFAGPANGNITIVQMDMSRLVLGIRVGLR